MKKLIVTVLGVLVCSALLSAQSPTASQLLDQAIAAINQAKALINTPPPPPPTAVNCVVSAWTMQSATAWGTCTNNQQTRTEVWARSVTTPPANGGAACPALTETRTGTQACSVTPPPPGTGPVVTGFSGVATHGGTLTLTGARFGTKPSAAPVKFDDFQNLSTGQDLSINGWKTAGGIHPKASTARLRPGTPYTKNALAEFSSAIPFSQGGDVSNFYLTGQAFKKGYADFWLFTHVVSGTPGNQKPIRWHNTSAGSPNLYFNIYTPPGDDLLCFGRDGTSRNDSDWCDATTPAFYDQWRHVQYSFDIGSGSSAANGSAKVWFDGALVYSRTAAPVWAGGAQGIPEVYLGNYLRTDEGASLQNFWEAVYVDSSWARVEIGNAATYAACTHREIQVPSAWSDGTITVKVNRGSFATVSGVYLFVVDSSGAVSPGFRLP